MNAFGSPLCGVADARMSESVRGASVRTSALLPVPTFVALCTSSTTTMSHFTFSNCARYFGCFNVSIDTITRGKYVNGFLLAGNFCRTF